MVATTPKPQQYPASLMQVGAVVYSVLAWTDEDTGKTSTEYEEWHVRSIKARRGSKSRMGYAMFAQGDTAKRVNLTQKVEHVTWVKRAGKTGWAASAPDYLTKQFRAGDPLPHGLYTTKRAALVYAIRSHQDGHKRYDQWIAEAKDDKERAEWRANQIIHEAEMRALGTRLTKEFGKRPTPPA